MTVFSQHGSLLGDVIELHGRWRSQREAVVCNGTRLNWSQFNARLNRVAHASHTSGLRSGDRAIVLMTNGLPMLEVLMGLMKAGITTVPINLSVTDASLVNMIADASPRAIFCTKAEAIRVEAHSELAEISAGLIRICDSAPGNWLDFEAWTQDASELASDWKVDPDTPLNIIYSSGTTGIPKGIVHTQRGRREWAGDLAVALRYHGGARTLITIGMYSNISWVGLLCTVLAGGTLLIETGFDAARFWELASNERCTHSSMVPLQLDRILDADPDPSAPSCLQAIVSAGSPLFPGLKQQLLNRFGLAIIELYGLTEGVITTLDPEVAHEKLSSVGQPLLGTDLKIIGDDDQELPVGEAGEIVATGRIVMPGYWNKPEATRDAAWTAPDGTVWLRTGDIGRVDESGYLFIVDRKKDMIVSGGQNIYPQDIEAELMIHPAVSEAAVIGAHSRKWGETPIGLIVLREAVAPDTIRIWCNGRVGKQQRLADLIVLPALPRNPNGKILKRELRQQFKDRTYD